LEFGFEKIFVAIVFLSYLFDRRLSPTKRTFLNLVHTLPLVEVLLLVIVIVKILYYNFNLRFSFHDVVMTRCFLVGLVFFVLYFIRYDLLVLKKLLISFLIVRVLTLLRPNSFLSILPIGISSQFSEQI